MIQRAHSEAIAAAETEVERGNEERQALGDLLRVTTEAKDSAEQRLEATEKTLEEVGVQSPSRQPEMGSVYTVVIPLSSFLQLKESKKSLIQDLRQAESARRRDAAKIVEKEAHLSKQGWADMVLRWTVASGQSFSSLCGHICYMTCPLATEISRLNEELENLGQQYTKLEALHQNSLQEHKTFSDKVQHLESSLAEVNRCLETEQLARTMQASEAREATSLAQEKVWACRAMGSWLFDLPVMFCFLRPFSQALLSLHPTTLFSSLSLKKGTLSLKESSRKRKIDTRKISPNSRVATPSLSVILVSFRISSKRALPGLRLSRRK